MGRTGTRRAMSGILSIAIADVEKLAAYYSADLYHWSAMSFRNHWRAAVGVAIMKHTARCLRGAGMSAVRKRGVDDPRPHDGLDSI